MLCPIPSIRLSTGHSPYPLLIHTVVPLQTLQRYDGVYQERIRGNAGGLERASAAGIGSCQSEAHPMHKGA